MSQLLAPAVFLAVIWILVPLLAAASREVFDSTEIEIDRHPFYAEAILVQLLLLLLAMWAARSTEIRLTYLTELDGVSLVSAVAVLLVAIAAFLLSWRYASDVRRSRLLKIVPKTPSERAVWSVVSLAAGFSEEIIYRGVLFGLLAIWTGNWLVAALLASVAFGLAHLAQGVVSAIAVAVFGFVLQLLVAQSGALALVIGVHFVYDLVAGLAISLIDDTSGVEL